MPYADHAAIVAPVRRCRSAKKRAVAHPDSKRWFPSGADCRRGGRTCEWQAGRAPASERQFTSHPQKRPIFARSRPYFERKHFGQARDGGANLSCGAACAKVVAKARTGDDAIGFSRRRGWDKHRSMTLTLTSLPQLATLDFDDIIDVRSPAEFAEDHVPGAINLPVLDDAERARVGTIYTQQSSFLARKMGAALVARNSARHLEGALADREGGWRPLVYCWRGGQRSGSFASILAQIGWRVDVLEGGYKAWRRLVVEAVQEVPVAAPMVVLDGYTGTAKTELLGLLATRGHQVLDLEGMANHRGSLFGEMPGGQPSQKTFEGRLALALAQLDPGRPVVVEAESSRIGDVTVPKMMWRAMCDAPRVTVAAPRGARAAYLARTYADIARDRSALAEVIGKMRRLHAHEVIDRWIRRAESGEIEALADELMEQHYDPRYAKSRARYLDRHIAEVRVESLAPDALDGVAERVSTALAAIRP